MKRFLPFLFLSLIAISAQSQGVGHYIELGKAFIDKPENIDSTYVYQLPARFCFALTGRTQKVGFIAISEFNLNFSLGDVFTLSLPSQSLSHLGERVCKKVGFEVGYGSMSFGYDVEIGQKSAQYKRSMSLGLQNLKWGIRASYLGLQNYITSTMTIGTPDDIIYMDTIEQSEGLGKLRNISADGYYVFNNKRFGYTATNVMNVVQKHTAGSFMLGGRFLWSDLDTQEDMSGLFESYSTIQFAVGGGYSANIVLWHRDAVDNNDRTVRNMTFNITAMPVISLVNYMQTRAYKVEMDENNVESVSTKKSDVWCYPSPNIITTTALSMTFGRFYFTSQFQFNMFYFTSSSAIKKDNFEAPNWHYQDEVFNVDITDLKIHGVLFNWTLNAKLFYRF